MSLYESEKKATSAPDTEKEIKINMISRKTRIVVAWVFRKASLACNKKEKAG
jgi:hypothetical protein